MNEESTGRMVFLPGITVPAGMKNPQEEGDFAKNYQLID
jgi:hypothetical protein